MFAWKLGPALAMGNTIVMKVSRRYLAAISHRNLTWLLSLSDR